MSVTLNDVLKLSSFKNAKVVAGKNGLDKVVTSITVLEYANTTIEHNLIFDSIKFIGGELVVTSFASSKDDIDAQITNIKFLSSVGEVGLAVYYVGIILPKIDDRVIKLCDELNFPLICMPENDPTLQYSNVINETMDLVIRNQMNSSTFALDILEQISKLPRNQQTVDTLLALTSNRIRASVALLNNDSTMLSAAAWPRYNDTDWDSILNAINIESKKTSKASGFLEKDGWYYYEDLKSYINRKIKLVIYADGIVLDPDECQQSVEAIRLGLNLWGSEHEKIGREELLKAILQDEPLKMRRLAAIYNIDVASINEAWIIHPTNEESIINRTYNIKDISDNYMDVCICEAYEEDIILMPAGTISLGDVNEWLDALNQYIEDEDIKVSVTRCSCLQNTYDVKEAFWNHKNYIMDAQRVFPNRTHLNLQEILFVKKCREITNQGEQNLARYTFVVDQLSKGSDGKEILNTLQVFLLDTHFSVTETANALFVHKNTVKYRLGKVSNILGFRIGEMPSSENVMIAMGLIRLLK